MNYVRPSIPSRDPFMNYVFKNNAEEAYAIAWHFLIPLRNQLYMLGNAEVPNVSMSMQTLESSLDIPSTYAPKQTNAI